MFTLSGVIAWVGKQAQLSAKTISIGDGRQLIAQAITKGHIESRVLVALGPFHLHLCHSISCNQDMSPQSANLPMNAE